MFICNIKLNLKLIAKIFFIAMGIIVLILFCFGIYKTTKGNFRVKDNIKEPVVSYVDSSNYSNILKNVYENVDNYIGQKICFVGYVYKQTDFRENEFVLARDMQSSNDNQKYIVGFLCDCKNASAFLNGDWVKVTGEISEGDYHGVIPILKVLEIDKTEEPADSIIPPPDNTYIPTCYIF